MHSLSGLVQRDGPSGPHKALGINAGPHDLSQVADVLAHRQMACLDARVIKQVIHQPREVADALFGTLQHVVGRAAPGGDLTRHRTVLRQRPLYVMVRQLYEALDRRQGRLELVGGQGHKLVHPLVGLPERPFLGVGLRALAQEALALQRQRDHLRRCSHLRAVHRRIRALRVPIVHREDANQPGIHTEGSHEEAARGGGMGQDTQRGWRPVEQHHLVRLKPRDERWIAQILVQRCLFELLSPLLFLRGG